MITAAELVDSPRGRVLCAAVAHRLDQGVWSAWLHSAWDLTNTSKRDAFVRELTVLDVSGLDRLHLVAAVAETVDHARYWQPPHAEEFALRDDAVVAALMPIAQAIIACRAASWWSDPVDLTRLRNTAHFENHPPPPPQLTGTRQQLRQWRADTLADDARPRPDDPTAPYSGQWWSTPGGTSLPVTTRPLDGLGSVGLVWEEDGFGLADAQLWSMATTGPVRVWEIDGPQAWARLVERYPLEVTRARRQDWYRVTGLTGRWLIPDWSAVAADWDAVHVSVAGYLGTATRAVSLAEADSATVLAGWSPDQTWWLTDVLTPTDTEFWHRTEDSWHRPNPPVWLASRRKRS